MGTEETQDYWITDDFLQKALGILSQLFIVQKLRNGKVEELLYKACTLGQWMLIVYCIIYFIIYFELFSVPTFKCPYLSYAKTLIFYI